MKKLITLFILSFTFYGVFAQSLVSIDPDSAYQGTSIKALIVGKGTHFTTATFTTIRLNQGPNQISRDSFTVINDTALYAYFTFGMTNPVGTYNLNVTNSVDKTMNLGGKFWLIKSPFSPSLFSIDPDSAYQGTSIKALIIAKNTKFVTATFTVIRLSLGMNQINRDSFTVINDTAIYAYFTIASTRPTGTYNLTVNNNLDGNMTLNGKFWVVTSPFAPKLLSIDPDSTMQGTSIKALIIAKNTNFSTATFTVIRLSQTFTQINYDSFNVINDTALYAYFTISMARPVGAYNLAVSNSIDGNLTVNGIFWVIKSPYTPVLLSIDPDSAYQVTSIKALIRSSYTNFTKSNITVLRLTRGMTNINNDSFTIVNDTTIYAYFTFSMSSTPGLYGLNVNSSLDGNLTKTQCFTVIVPNAPKLFSVDPDTAMQGKTVSATITGINTHFDSGLNLAVSLFRAPNTTVNPTTIVRKNDTSLVADFTIAANMALGLWDVRVSNSNDGQLTLAQSFTVIANPNPPKIVKVDPDTFIQGNKYLLKIYASKTNFTKGNIPTVRLNFQTVNINPDSIKIINDTLINAYFTIALNATTGKYNLSVNGGFDGNLNLAEAVTILVSPTAPQIWKISPAKAYQGNKVAISIYGKNVTFTNGTNQLARLTRGGGQFINPDSTRIIHDSLAIGYFSIATTAQAGLYSMILSGTVHGNLTLVQCFEVLIPPTAPQIRFITPSRAALGANVNITVYTGNTTLTKATNLTLTLFRQGGTNINATGVTALNDTTVNASLSIPADAVLGMYNARLQNTPEGNLVGNNMFEIIAVPVNPTIVSVSPDSVYYGQNNVVLNLKCKDTKFSRAKMLKVEIISPSINLLTYDSVKIVDDLELNVYLSVPKNAELGQYDIVITSDIEGMFMKTQALTIIHNVSVDEFSELKTYCYPNPVNNILNIGSNNLITRIEIRDVTGRLMLRNDNLSDYNYNLSFDAYQSGIYFVTVFTNNQLQTTQIIKF